MRKKILIVVLVILILFGSTIPILYDQEADQETSTLLPGVNEYVTSADGDISDESILSFEETLPDDTLFYPDLFLNTTVIVANAGTYTGTGEINDWTATQVKDGTVWRASVTPADMELEFDGQDNLRGFDYAVYVTTSGGGDDPELYLYDFDATAYVKVYDISPNSWHNGTVYDPDYWDSNEGVKMKIEDEAGESAYWDYAEIQTHVMHLADSNHYAESFADVSDWQNLGSATMVSDGDVTTLTQTTGSGNGWSKSDVFAPVDWSDYYLEIRIVSVSYRWAMYLLGSAGFYTVQTDTSSVGTFKYHLSSSDAKLDVVDQFQLYVIGDDNTVVFDYLRVSPADESGLQHDGSTTEGVVTGGGSGGTMTTDGDYVSLIADGDGSTFDFFVDTTATQAKLDPDHYPFIEMQFHADDVGEDVRVQYYTTGYGDIQTQTAIVQTMRWNLRAATSSDVLKFRVWVYSGGTTRVKFLQIYSIANFTYAAHASTPVTNYAYVDANSDLRVSMTNGYWFGLYNDPAFTVAVASYPVWNITAGDLNPTGSNDFLFQPVVGSTENHYDEWRGGWDQSGTMTDYGFIFYSGSEFRISELKFIEDGTDPTIIRSNVNPPDPDDDEAVTLSSLVSDAVEVYTVKFNAIVYPGGFSDVDYSASEVVGDFWSYEFSSGDLIAGYYSFQVTASDGANENQHLTEFEYIDFTVRISAIVISPITFFGAGDDFGSMQISFEINKDCTYTIYEVSDSQAESATGTGSVTEGWNNIAWTKLDVVDSTVNFSIKFVSGSLTEYVNGSYGVAQTVFVLEDHMTTDHKTQLSVSGRITKDASWALYYDGSGSSSYSGSVSEGNFFLSWTKHETPGSHTWTLTFTNGSDSISVGGSFETYQYSIDDPPANVIPDPLEDWRVLQTTWQNIGIIIIILGIIGILIRDLNLNLPDMKD